MQIKVSELIVKYMERLGIEVIFGMPGAHILPVYDGIYHSNIQAVLAKHEQGASFMASGYSRACGQISACIATAGPGATNLVTGIANAYADKQPVLAITGETSTHIFGKGGLQESSGEGGSVDQVELFRSITRYCKRIERADYLPQVLKQATRILRSDNPGPVLLSLPFNVQQEMVDDAVLDEIHWQQDQHTSHETPATIDSIVELIADAKAPVIIAGYGCILSGAQQFVAQLSESMAIPVASSLKGKGALSEQSELSLGSLGVTSSGRAYQYILEQADLLIFLGAGFNERTSYLWDKKLLENKKIIQIDNNPEQLEKVFKADIALNEDIDTALAGINQVIEGEGLQREMPEERQQYIAELKSSSNNDYALFSSGFSLIKTFFAKLETHFPKDAVIFDDNVIFAQNFLNVSSGNRYFPNSGVSSLGHAIPAAIGARFCANKPTFAILGDGGFQMCCMEIMTAVNYDKPLNIVMFNNATMGLIRKNQHQHYDKRYINCDFTNPDYKKLADSFGIHYKKVETEAGVEELFEQYDLNNDINLIEVMIDKDAFPNYSSKR